MEGKRLEKKIRDWATALNFTLPDGSAPPADYYALLVATPHRRQLWETLSEAVQPRKKIEHMRKQILAARLRDKNKYLTKNDSSPAVDRIDLWHKQNAVENLVKESRNRSVELEKNIIAKTSDLLFEICKIAELEKLYEESSEKALTLRLFTKRENDIIKSLEKTLLKAVGASDCSEYFKVYEPELQNNLNLWENELLEKIDCNSKISLDHGHDCKLSYKLNELCESGLAEPLLWEEIMKCKKNLLEKFSEFLEGLNSNEKTVLSEKETEIENTFNLSVTRLKQKTTERALQVMLNSAEGQALDWKIEKLEEELSNRRPLPKGSVSETLDEAILMLSLNETSESLENEKAIKNLNNYVGMKSYQAFLIEESKRLDEEVAKVESKEGVKEAENEFQANANSDIPFDSIIFEIDSLQLDEEELEREIIRCHDIFSRVLQSLKDQGEKMNKATGIYDNIEKLKSASRQLIDVFLQTPWDAFKTVESSSGRLLFECESLPHCLNSYGGELNQFFGAMLIPPQGDSREILEQIDKRQKMLNEVKSYICDRDKLAQLQRKLRDRMSSIKYDTRVCEMNYKESDGILWNVLHKTDELLHGIDYIKKILQNWVEQPYRLMAKK